MQFDYLHEVHQTLYESLSRQPQCSHVLDHFQRGAFEYRTALGKPVGRLGRLGVRLHLCFDLFGSLSVRVTSPNSLLHGRACESLDSAVTCGPAASCCRLCLWTSIPLVDSPVVCFVILMGCHASDGAGMQVHFLP